MKDWNLSDNRRTKAISKSMRVFSESDPYYFEEDVKEFIKRLKEMNIPTFTGYSDTAVDYPAFRNEIDKLAGEKLI